MRTVIVAAGILIEADRVLLTQRKIGTHLAGMWEFPGGKVEAGEDPKEALVRELHEELGIDVAVGDVLDVTFHRYEDKAVLLLFYEVTRTPGSSAPSARDVAAFSWEGASGLDPARFPPADVAILAKVGRRLAGNYR
jgi:8-oxo-dGTP diphosphatase